MKFQACAALVCLAATTVSAQYKQTGPWTLHIKGTASNSKLNGYGQSCHAGAALEGLCYTPSIDSSSDYIFNYTTYDKVEGHNTGILTWNLPYTGEDNKLHYVSQAMSLAYQSNSNVAAAMFGFDDGFQVGWDSHNELFGYSYLDDSKFKANKPPQPPADGKVLYQWAVCWQYNGGYYYQSVAWIQSGKPHNPTCETVEITRKKATN
ncbi:hypothetical protein F5Y18DRAFT_394009 [Xylariaceae sp. FL1019]|nr:hypothetical protein F5Y18DRAFT_394009 [Xylariaceae sp. FL1019]